MDEKIINNQYHYCINIVLSQKCQFGQYYDSKK